MLWNQMEMKQKLLYIGIIQGHICYTQYFPYALCTRVPGEAAAGSPMSTLLVAPLVGLSLTVAPLNPKPLTINPERSLASN